MVLSFFPPFQQVFKAFRDIAATSGEKSGERKKNLIQGLLVSAKGLEAGYVMRALQVRFGGGVF